MCELRRFLTFQTDALLQGKRRPIVKLVSGELPFLMLGPAEKLSLQYMKQT